MTIAILILLCVILILVIPSAVLWIWLSITLLRNEKDEHKKLLDLAEVEKNKKVENEFQSNTSKN